MTSIKTAVPVHAVRVPRFDVGTRPFLVLFELTRACDLACRHCRAEAIPTRHPDELTTTEIHGVLDDLAALGAPRPVVVLTGGDPFKRPDIAELVRYGAERGLAMAVSPSGTPLATRSRLAALRDAGAHTVSFSIDGATPARHDGFRGVDGSYALTRRACTDARELGLRLQINTTVTATTVEDLPGIARLVCDLGAGLWSVFFLVGTGRGRALRALDATETEDVLHVLADLSAIMPLKTTEAPQFRRVLAQRGAGAPSAHGPSAHGAAGRGALYHRLTAELAEHVAPEPWPPRRPHAGTRTSTVRPPLSVGDGRGVVFVSHTGDVTPSGFLPLVAGNVRDAPLTAIYRDAALLRALRDTDRLGGRCGRCEYRAVCGGSRARAFAATGDPLAEDPGCPYQPPGTDTGPATTS